MPGIVERGRVSQITITYNWEMELLHVVRALKDAVVIPRKFPWGAQPFLFDSINCLQSKQMIGNYMFN
jgi:hypothetical protein